MTTHFNDDFAHDLGVVHAVKESHEHSVAILLLTDLQDIVLERLDDHLPILAEGNRDRMCTAPYNQVHKMDHFQI